MEILYLLIACSLAIALVFLVFFLKAVRSGQFDDGITPAMRMVYDDDGVGRRLHPESIKGTNKSS